MITGAYGYDVRPVKQDGDIDSRAQKDGFMRLDDAMEAARLLSGHRRRDRLVYQKVQVKDADTGWVVAEFIHGDRLVKDHRSPRDEAMRDAGFPIIAGRQIAAEVAADVHRLGLDRRPGRTQ